MSLCSKTFNTIGHKMLRHVWLSLWFKALLPDFMIVYSVLIRWIKTKLKVLFLTLKVHSFISEWSLIFSHWQVITDSWWRTSTFSSARSSLTRLWDHVSDRRHKETQEHNSHLPAQVSSEFKEGSRREVQQRWIKSESGSTNQRR